MLSAGQNLGKFNNKHRSTATWSGSKIKDEGLHRHSHILEHGVGTDWPGWGVSSGKETITKKREVQDLTDPGRGTTHLVGWLESISEDDGAINRGKACTTIGAYGNEEGQKRRFGELKKAGRGPSCHLTGSIGHGEGPAPEWKQSLATGRTGIDSEQSRG